MKRCIQKGLVLMLICLSSGYLIVESFANENSKEHQLSHTYVYHEVGGAKDVINEQGHVENVKTFIGICSVCKEYYYTDIHQYWYKLN